MLRRSLRIAWLGPVPGGVASATGVNAELLHGLAERGHRIVCFFPSAGHPLPPDLLADGNLQFVWGTNRWQWDKWYSRTKFTAFASGLFARGFASVRLRQAIVRSHAREPYDLIFQTSSIESLAVPRSVARTIPLVIRPDTHIAGELRWLIAERRLSFRAQPRYVFLLVAAIMAVRVLVQRISIGRARLLVCISAVFRDHLVRDYSFPAASTIVVPNPVKLDRFSLSRPSSRDGTATVLVLGRVSTRKGIEDVVAVAKSLLERQRDIRIRVVGGPSLWSDYTRLLDDLPDANAEYAGSISSAQVPEELANADILLQASRYEPFALTVAEALAAGVPVVATSEVGAIEGVDRSVVAEVQPGDVEGFVVAIETLLARSRADPVNLSARARAEAQRLFAPEKVCEQLSDALERLVDEAECDGT